MMQDFSQMGLSAPLLSALKKVGYSTPTPIQAQAIPSLLQGRDLLGIAQTGTGKTAAFALPILQHLGGRQVRAEGKHCRVLVLTPTRELAAQIHKSFRTYGEGLRIRTTVIFGGVNQGPQVTAMHSGQDVLIATPGRLLDLMNQGKIKLSQLEVFVLDEADRMLDMGFINDVRKVVAKLPAQRQTLLFSATMPKDIAQLAQSLLRNPVRVEVTPESTTVEKIDQRVLFVDRKNKPQLLRHLLQSEKVKQALVFSRTKHGANKITKYLDANGIQSAALHGNKSQAARTKALEGFKSGTIRILVATDIAARGIDIPGLGHVFNFDLPEVPESYVHRIGRTARAGRGGVAFSFCDAGERDLLKGIEKNIRMKINVESDHPYPAQITEPPPKEPQQPRGRPSGKKRRSFSGGSGSARRANRSGSQR